MTEADRERLFYAQMNDSMNTPAFLRRYPYTAPPVKEEQVEPPYGPKAEPLEKHIADATEPTLLAGVDEAKPRMAWALTVIGAIFGLIVGYMQGAQTASMDGSNFIEYTGFAFGYMILGLMIGVVCDIGRRPAE